MNPLSINWRELAFAVAVFILILIGFVMLATFMKWPNDRGGWPLAVTIALVIAFLPLIARGLSFLQQSQASVETLGLKFSFASTAEKAEVKTAMLSENIVQPGFQIVESGIGELDRAAVESTNQTVVIIDLKDGRAWYRTRLFAVAATAQVQGAPRLIVLIGQRGGKQLQIGGWIRPQDVVTAVTSTDPAIASVWQHAQAYLGALHAYALLAPAPAYNPNLPKLQNYYTNQFKEIGNAAIMRILVDQMRSPDPGGSLITLEGPNLHPWINLRDIEQQLDPWLVRDTVDLSKSPNDQNDTVLAGSGEIVIATRDGQFVGIVDVRRAERDLLRQLVHRTAV